MYSITRGFTIFLAVLIASLALAIGLAIYDLASRELNLSITQTQSQYAIYAADTGAECALYWDFKYNTVIPTDADGSAFATSSDYVYGGTASPGQVYCNGQDIVGGSSPLQFPWTITAPDPSDATTTFEISMGQNQSSSCVRVTVAKNGNPVRTTITAHGYNTCALGASLVVERILQVNY